MTSPLTQRTVIAGVQVVYGTTVYFFKNSCTNWIAKPGVRRRAEACVAATAWSNNNVNFLLSGLDLLEQKQFINLCVDEDDIEERKLQEKKKNP
jgi:hypothetical protein